MERCELTHPSDAFAKIGDALASTVAVRTGEWSTDGAWLGCPDQYREAARSCGMRLALGFDDYWVASERAPDGPIDVIDMFSGCGGMSAGFRAVNGLFPAFRLAMAIDIDAVANTTYERNLALRPIPADMSVLAKDKKRLVELISRSRRREGHPLVLIGCAPCQGFSSHRNSEGERDQRNSLFGDFARIAAQLRPDAVVVENVPELLTGRYWGHVEEARTTLEQAGYFVHLSVHNMAEFGVHQERYRALLLALPKRFCPPQGFLSRSDFRTVRQAIGDLPRLKAGRPHPRDRMHYTAGHRDSTIATIRAVPKNGGSRPADAGPECLRRLRDLQGRSGYDDIYGRLNWDRPAITITASARNPASGRFVHPEQDRGLSVREAALLQSFPRNYNFEGGLDPSFRQIGNAVPPAFAAYLAVHLLGEMLGDAPDARDEERGILRPVASSFSRVIPALKAGHLRTTAPSRPLGETGCNAV